MQGEAGPGRESNQQEPLAEGKLIMGPWLKERAEREARELADRYSRSDEHDRLNLWLQHRDLRTVFNDLAE